MISLRTLFILAIVGQVLDGTLTYVGLNRGFQEGNPIIRPLIAYIGQLPAILLAKLSSIAILLFFWNHREKRGAYTYLVLLNLLLYALAIIPWIVVLYLS